uniref:Clip domain-containing protein n=1 Tax=Timema douglasi TaxID=61478 RepID=A0A7R8Z8Y7_TIMDO|nr:unnamed protein product [Timema douglasi]
MSRWTTPESIFQVTYPASLPDTPKDAPPPELCLHFPPIVIQVFPENARHKENTSASSGVSRLTPHTVTSSTTRGSVLAFVWRESGKQLGGKKPQFTRPGLNPDLPVISSLVNCKSNMSIPKRRDEEQVNSEPVTTLPVTGEEQGWFGPVTTLPVTGEEQGWFGPVPALPVTGEERGADCDCDVRGAVTKEQVVISQPIPEVEQNSTITSPALQHQANPQMPADFLSDGSVVQGISKSNTTVLVSCPNIFSLVIAHACTDIRFQSRPSCRTPDNKNGRCINIKQCPELLSLLRSNRQQPGVAQFLRGSACGYDGFDPKVCCTDTTSRLEEGGGGTTPPPVPLPSFKGGALPQYPQCGFSNVTSQRIVGGYPSRLGEFRATGYKG